MCAELNGAGVRTNDEQTMKVKDFGVIFGTLRKENNRVAEWIKDKLTQLPLPSLSVVF